MKSYKGAIELYMERQSRPVYSTKGLKVHPPRGGKVHPLNSFSKSATLPEAGQLNSIERMKSIDGEVEESNLSFLKSLTSWILGGNEIQISNVLLGKGSWNETYEAKIRKRQVVANVMKKEANEDDLLQLFVRSCYLYTKIVHPSIRSMHGFTQRAPLIQILEYASGERTLRTCLQDAKLLFSLSNGLLDCCCNLLTALVYMSGSGITHCGIATDSVFVRDDGSAVLGNLESACLPSGEDDDVHSFLTGSLPFQHGQPEYSAPELLAGERNGPATDMYAFGIVLLECVSVYHRRAYAFDPYLDCEARIPSTTLKIACYPKSTIEEYLKSVGAGQMPKAPEIVSERWPIVSTTIDKCLSSNAGERMSAMTALRRLQRCSSHQDTEHDLGMRFEASDRLWIRLALALSCDERSPAQFGDGDLCSKLQFEEREENLYPGTRIFVAKKVSSLYLSFALLIPSLSLSLLTIHPHVLPPTN